MAELDVDLEVRASSPAHEPDDRRDRDDRDPRPARADLPRQRVQDDAPLDDRDADPHRGGHRRRGVLRRRGRGAATRSTTILRTEIAPRLIGEDAFRVERCWELARPATFDILRDRRLGLVATACVDAAIWDAIGKALGQPLHRLWGGYRDSLPVITIGGYYGKQDIAEEVAELREQGLAGMKFKVGGLTPEEDAARFRTARAAAGPDFVLCADANQGWTPAEAVRFARLVEDLDLHWFEEPCIWSNDRRAMRDVRFGGRRARLRGAERVLRRRLPRPDGRGRDRLLQLRLVLVGRRDRVAPRRRGRASRSTWRWPITRSRRSRPTCSPRSRTARSSRCSAPSATRSGGTSSPTGPPIVDGRMTLPTGPGLGWELDADYIEAHRVPPRP